MSRGRKKHAQVPSTALTVYVPPKRSEVYYINKIGTLVEEWAPSGRGSTVKRHRLILIPRGEAGASIIGEWCGWAEDAFLELSGRIPRLIIVRRGKVILGRYTRVK